MFTEGMACPLEARGRGLGEYFINCAHYVSVERLRSCGSQVSLASCMWDESSASPTIILWSFFCNVYFFVCLFVCVYMYVCVCVCLQVPEILFF